MAAREGRRREKVVLKEVTLEPGLRERGLNRPLSRLLRERRAPGRRGPGDVTADAAFEGGLRWPRRREGDEVGQRARKKGVLLSPFWP